MKAKKSFTYLYEGLPAFECMCNFYT